MKSIKVCEYSRSRSYHYDLILQDQASGERSQDQWSSGLFLAWGSPIRMALDPSRGNIYLTAESHWSWWLDNWSFLGVVSPTGAYKKLQEGDSLNRFTVNIPGDIVLHAEKG